jgi:hypothetical protein
VSEAPERARFEVVRVDENVHLPLLRDFIREVWTSSLSLEALRASRQQAAAKNLANPGEPLPTFLFLLGGRAVGHLTTIPTRFRWGGVEGPAHWLKGFWVLEEHRNGPIGALLVRRAAQELDCLLATVVDRAPRRVFEAFKLRDVGVLTDHVRLLRPERVIAQIRLDAIDLGERAWLRRAHAIARQPGIAHLLGAAVRVGCGAYAGLVGAGAHVRVARTRPEPEALDRFWRSTAEDVPYGVVRDGAYLAATHDPESDLFVVLERNGALAGWARVRRPRTSGTDPRLAGLRVASLSDVVVSPAREEDGLALLRAAEGVAREAGADALLCGASHGRLKGWLERRAFVPVGSRVHFAARGPASAEATPESAEACWLTRADGGADEGF